MTDQPTDTASQRLCGATTRLTLSPYDRDHPDVICTRPVTDDGRHVGQHQGLDQVAALTIDTTRWVAVFAQMQSSLQKMVRGVAERMSVINPTNPTLTRLRTVANNPVRVAGLEARYQVRAAMDPAYATPEGLGVLVRSILDPDGEGVEGLWLVSPENRRLVAVAAMRGWAQTHPGLVPLVAHRQWGTTHVQVCCG